MLYLPPKQIHQPRCLAHAHIFHQACLCQSSKATALQHFNAFLCFPLLAGSDDEDEVGFDDVFEGGAEDVEGLFGDRDALCYALVDAIEEGRR